MCVPHPYCYFYCWYTCRIMLDSDEHNVDCCYFRWYWQKQADAALEWEAIREAVKRDYGIQEGDEDCR